MYRISIAPNQDLMYHLSFHATSVIVNMVISFSSQPLVRSVQLCLFHTQVAMVALFYESWSGFDAICAVFQLLVSGCPALPSFLWLALLLFDLVVRLLFSFFERHFHLLDCGLSALQFKQCVFKSNDLVIGGC